MLLMHLLKMRHQPQRKSRSWAVTIITQRVDIDLLLRESPSLRPTLQDTLLQIYPNARREAAQGTGLPIDSLPEKCPFTLSEVLSEDVWPQPDDGIDN